MTDPAALYEDVVDEMGTVLIGNEEIVEGLTIAMLTRGHVLLEGVPGVAKTTLANLFARATGLEYNRIQLTPDLLPADITGTYVYREATGEFELQRGPVFANIVIADEINRATPKTQSALLEAMQEETVTIEGETLELPMPFIVVATQNPIEMEGVFPLPEAQRDRFQLKLTLGHPERDDELELLDRFDDDPELGPGVISQIATPADILEARDVVADVYVDQSVKEYVLDLVSATRESPDVDHGASPRASIALLDSAKARAAIHGREYVIPDDVKELSESVLRHRLVLGTEAELSDVTAGDVIADVRSSVPAPSASAADEAAATATASDGGDVEPAPDPETDSATEESAGNPPEDEDEAGGEETDDGAS